jgi:hypothetical protein
MVINHLEKILEPCPQEEFFASSWGKTYKHVPGWTGKFSSLLPWDQLNKILQQHRLDFPRLRLTRDGESLPVNSYLRYAAGGRRKIAIPRLQQDKLTQQLNEGATLVLDAVDELSDTLTELAEGLEFLFHERIQINAYAGWRTSQGFDLHWDDHDVFILQVTGRKHWKIYGMTRAYPLAQDSEQARKPTQEPLWEQTLDAGDLLYIPRGWWHVARPLDEPTLHLTVGVHNRTGIDFMRHLSDRLRASEIFRADLPRFASSSDRAFHLERLREELLTIWDQDALARYFAELDEAAEPRPRLGLPWSATQAALPASPQAFVRLLAPRPLDLKLVGDVVEITCHKKRWRFSSGALLVLRPLVERRVCSVAELCEAAAGKLQEETVRAFLRELIAHGLIVVQK